MRTSTAINVSAKDGLTRGGRCRSLPPLTKWTAAPLKFSLHLSTPHSHGAHSTVHKRFYSAQLNVDYVHYHLYYLFYIYGYISCIVRPDRYVLFAIERLIMTMAMAWIRSRTSGRGSRLDFKVPEEALPSALHCCFVLFAIVLLCESIPLGLTLVIWWNDERKIRQSFTPGNSVANVASYLRVYGPIVRSYEW